jgi:hypothetical protein
MLKEGHKHLSGLEEAVLKNIEACKQLAQITRTSMGPNGGQLLGIVVTVTSRDGGDGVASGFVWRQALPLLPHCSQGSRPPSHHRNEQDGYQPPGEAIRDQRCIDNHPGAGGAAPSRQASGHGSTGPAAGDW